jgi:sporulation protein YlmC with PRC-barrel domain
MKNRLTLAAGLLLAMASAPTIASVAYAAISSNEAVTSDHNMRASKLIGMTVYNDQGAAVGKVEDVLVASGTTEASVILSVGDFVGGGEKMVRVPLGHVHLAADKLAMPTATKEHLATMPAWTFTGLNGGGG